MFAFAFVVLWLGVVFFVFCSDFCCVSLFGCVVVVLSFFVICVVLCCVVVWCVVRFLFWFFVLVSCVVVVVSDCFVFVLFCLFQLCFVPRTSYNILMTAFTMRLLTFAAFTCACCTFRLFLAASACIWCASACAGCFRLKAGATSKVCQLTASLDTRHRLLLTGTPLQNTVSQLKALTLEA